MDHNSQQPQMPQGPIREFTEEALSKKFSYSWTRRELITLVNLLRPIQLALGDIRNKVANEILDEIERTAIQSITDDDYKKVEAPQQPAQEPLPAAPDVTVQ